MRVLVVDDNRDTADALAWLLQSIGPLRIAKEAGFDRLLLKPAARS